MRHGAAHVRTALHVQVFTILWKHVYIWVFLDRGNTVKKVSRMDRSWLLGVLNMVKFIKQPDTSLNELVMQG